MTNSTATFLTLAAMVARATGGTAPSREGRDVDWRAFIGLCRQHRVAALILPVMADWPGLPPFVRDELRQAAQEGARFSMVLTAALIGLCRDLDAAGLRFLVLKGVPLSCLLHGDPARRLCGDIDLLVDPADMAAVAALLRDKGFQPTPGRPVLTGDPTLDSAIRDLSLWRGPVLVELHQRLTANPHRLPLTFEQLHAGRQMVPLGGTAIPTLGPEHLALYLFVHGAGHGWERLSWLADLAGLCRKPEMAARLHRQTSELGMQTAAGETFALLRDLLDCPPPPGAGVPARPSWLSLHLVRGEAGSGHGPAWLLHNLGKRWRGWRLRRGLPAFGREVAADLVNPIDHAYFRLPRGLVWLYPVLRPVGFLWRNFLHRPGNNVTGHSKSDDRSQ